MKDIDERKNEDMTNDVESIDTEELDAVSGGGLRNVGGRCRDYVCKYCGATPFGGTIAPVTHICTDIFVIHASDCQLKNMMTSGCKNCTNAVGVARCKV